MGEHYGSPEPVSNFASLTPNRTAEFETRGLRAQSSAPGDTCVFIIDVPNNRQ